MDRLEGDKRGGEAIELDGGFRTWEAVTVWELAVGKLT